MAFTKYQCVKQQDIKDCGAACLATISKNYGLNYPITKIREMSGTDKMGTSAYGLVKAAEKLGFTAKAVKGLTRHSSKISPFRLLLMWS